MLDPIRHSASDGAHRPSSAPLPPALASEIYDRRIATARGFHQRLLHLPLGRWVEVALSDPHAERAPDDCLIAASPSDVLQDAAARARLRAVLDQRPALVSQIRQRVVATAAAARGFTSDAVVSRMTRVALCAALAIIARPDLEDDEFERLYRPFERLIPVNELPA